MHRTQKVVVNDLMQKGYVYFLTEPVGQKFQPDFTPELTPAEMLQAASTVALGLR